MIQNASTDIPSEVRYSIDRVLADQGKVFSSTEFKNIQVLGLVKGHWREL